MSITQQLLRIVIGSILAICLTGCTYRIARTNDGYRLDNLPRKIVEEFPGSGEIEITLENSQNERTSIIGQAKRVNARDLEITTDDVFDFLPNPRRGIWLLLRMRPGTGEPGTCHGCPRDSSLQIYGNASICWCWSRIQLTGERLTDETSSENLRQLVGCDNQHIGTDRSRH